MKIASYNTFLILQSTEFRSFIHVHTFCDNPLSHVAGNHQGNKIYTTLYFIYNKTS